MSINWSEIFAKPGTEAWVDEIKRSVKDPKELENLIWHTDNGFDLNAFYREENTKDLPKTSLYKSDNEWEIRQLIFTDKIIAANQSAVKALENGADSLYFKGTQIGTEKEVDALLKNIKLDWTQLHFDFEESNVAWLYLYLDFIQTNQFDANQIKGSINFDPLAELLLQGNYHYDEKETQQIFGSAIQTVQSQLPEFKIVNINANLIRESGGSAVHEIAGALSMFVEYLDWADKNKMDPAWVWDHHQFHLSISNEYFMEIAKFRAFRLLFRELTKAYGEKERSPYVHAISLKRNKTIYDPHNNLIRGTSDAMAASIGGADSITILPFDEAYRLPDELSYRMTRNIQLILKEESRLNKVSDPSAGSYYIEQITHKLVTESWKLFMEMERSGGFVAAMKNKLLQQKIEVNAEKQQSDLMSSKQVLVGINKYVNKTETKTGEYTKVEHADISDRSKLAIPVKPGRLAEKIEFERLKLESHTAKDKN